MSLNIIAHAYAVHIQSLLLKDGSEVKFLALYVVTTFDFLNAVSYLNCLISVVGLLESGLQYFVSKNF